MRIELQSAPAALTAQHAASPEAPVSPRPDPMAGLIAALTRPDLYRIVETEDGLSVEPVEAPLM